MLAGAHFVRVILLLLFRVILLLVCTPTMARYFVYTNNGTALLCNKYFSICKIVVVLAYFVYNNVYY